MTKKLLLIIFCLMLCPILRANKYQIRGTIEVTNITVKNTVYNYIISKSSLAWINEFNPIKMDSVNTLSGTYLLDFDLIVDIQKNGVVILNTLKDFMVTQAQYIKYKHIEIIDMSHDSAIGKPCKIIEVIK